MSAAAPGTPAKAATRVSPVASAADAPVAGWLSRSSDLVLAALVVAIIALMILPLPRLMIDTLVAINMCIGVLLVLMGIYVSSALQFSAFPSVLLISTLFRLALSVATTRMILLHGDAGAIIDTFGNLVAGGNLVVGLVVFLIITVVQFLVIAKGAERVAEVGARFTLDAMPGKQLSIDSDLRSGLLDKHEARAKRRELELESKLHGSMDGAMKFVKGDAIAGIVIILVNLLGGLAIGVWQLGMDVDAAMSKYSILTIGDGLVAQIPALLGAMAAGLIVTRSTDSDRDDHLGESIRKQFGAIPRVLMVAGGVCLLMAFVPGFPSGVFTVLALVLGAGGAMLVPAMRLRAARLAPASFQDAIEARGKGRRKPVAPTDAAPVTQSAPLLLWLPRSLAGSGRDEDLRLAVVDAVDAFQERSGVPVPRIEFRWRADELDLWQLDAFDVPIARGEWSREAGHDPMIPLIDVALRRQATLFIGLQEASRLLVQLGETYPDIVKELVRVVPMQNLAAILRNLVDEQVPIRNLRAITEALVQFGPQEKSPDALTEFARTALARHTCHRLAPDGTLRVISPAPRLEELLSGSMRTVGGAQQVSLEPAKLARVRAALSAAVEAHAPAALICPMPLRRHLRLILAPRHPDLPVLSYNELVAHVSLDVLEQVSLEGSGAQLSVVGS